MRGRPCVSIGVILCIASGAIGVAAGEVQLRFAAQTCYSVGYGPTSIAIGDFNGDDYQDLAVTNLDSNDVSILLGNGDGSFAAQTRYPVPHGPSFVAVGDFDGNERQDLAVANYYCPSGVSVLFGDGNGSFAAPIHYPACYNAQSVTIGDFDGNGRQDLALATFYGVWVFSGNDDGSFGTPTRFSAGSCPHGVNFGDFDSDGRQDLAVANYLSHDVSVLLGNGDCNFDTPAQYVSGDRPESTAIGDFNLDGRQDLAVANFHNVAVHLGNGDGSFAAPTQHSAGSCPHGMAVGDLNNDGIQDLAVANGVASGRHDGNSVSVLLGNGDGSFAPWRGFATGRSPWTVAIGDLDGDGRQDLAVTNRRTQDVSVLLNRSFVVVSVDIGPMSINPYGRGAVPVTILGGEGFDATAIDVTTISFGPGAASIKHDLTDPFDYDEHLEDVDFDGYMDLTLHFETQATGIVCGDTEAMLTGTLLDGMQIEGIDTFETVGCNFNRPHRGMTDRGFERMQREQRQLNSEEQQHPGDLVEEQRVD